MAVLWNRARLIVIDELVSLLACDDPEPERLSSYLLSALLDSYELGFANSFMV